MRNRTIRNWIIVILLVSAVFRIGYLSFGKILPVMWDARRYASAAVALISYIDHSGPDTFSSEREDRYRFKHYYEKYIQGEQIEWLQYTPHTLTEARDDLYFSGPLYPFFLSVIFYLAPTADFTFVRIFGILIDILCNWLIILIGFRLVGRKAALVAGVAYAIYFPFIHSSTMLLLETSTSFLILSAIYCLMRAYENDSRKFYVLAGIITGLMIINKPTAMLLVIPIGLGFYFYARKKLPWSVLINRLLYMATPFLLIFVCWGTAASVKYGQLALRDPSYSASNLRQSTSIEFEGYDLDKVERDFWTRSVVGDIVNDPVGFSVLLVKKFNRLWMRPYEDSRRDFIVPFDWMRVIHLILVISGRY